MASELIIRYRLDVKAQGTLDYESIRIFLIHSITVKREKHYPFLEEAFMTYPP